MVFGGSTARARDARARSLIDNNINIAATKRTAPPVAEGTAMAATSLPAKPPTPAHDPRDAEVNAAAAAPELGSTAPIKPVAVKTVTVHPGQVRTAALSPLPSGEPQTDAGAGHGDADKSDHHRHDEKRFAAAGRRRARHSRRFACP